MPAAMSPFRVRQRALRTMNNARSPTWTWVTLPVLMSEKSAWDVKTVMAAAARLIQIDSPTTRPIATMAPSRHNRLSSCQMLESTS